MSSRLPIMCQHSFRKTHNCLFCGIRQHNNPAVKTSLFTTPIHCNSIKYLAHLRKRKTKDFECHQINAGTYILLSSICEKFTYGQETLALGIHLFQCLATMHQNQKLWASACLMVASKGIELDKNVPYLNRYQRYAEKSFTQAEYQAAQKTIFEAMGFDIQYCTFMTFLHFYLTSGVVFQSDKLNPYLISYFEDDALLRAKDMLRKGNFPKYHPEQLALAIIKEIRLKYNLLEWTDQLKEISGYQSKSINVLQDASVLGQLPQIQVNTKKVKTPGLKTNSIRRKIDQLSTLQTTKKIVVKPLDKAQALKENDFVICHPKEKLYATEQAPSEGLALYPRILQEKIQPTVGQPAKK